MPPWGSFITPPKLFNNSHLARDKHAFTAYMSVHSRASRMTHNSEQPVFRGKSTDTTSAGSIFSFIQIILSQNSSQKPQLAKLYPIQKACCAYHTVEWRIGPYQSLTTKSFRLLKMRIVSCPAFVDTTCLVTGLYSEVVDSWSRPTSDWKPWATV